MTRRNFTKLAAAAMASPAMASPALAAINSKFNGVMIGAQTYSFRTLPSLDDCIAAMKQIGLGYAELWDNQILPKDRSQVAAWRSNPPMDEIRGIRKKFDDAGIDLYAFNYSFRDEFTDEQIEKGFVMAKAMGVSRITASSNVDVSPRVDRYAEQYKIYVGYHDHDSMKPNEFSTPDDEMMQHLRGAGALPKARARPWLLQLAVEAVIPMLGGCAGALVGAAAGGLGRRERRSPGQWHRSHLPPVRSHQQRPFRRLLQRRWTATP